MPDLKLALRTLTRTPFITAMAVVSLALGIGANAAIFSLVEQTLLRALPVPEPDRLVNLGAPGPKGGSQSMNQAGDIEWVFSYAMFRDLERAEGPFTGIAAHRTTGVNLTFRNETLDADAVLVSGSYFPVLGLRPALGRLLTPADDERVGEHPVAVLSHRYWEERLGADASVLDATILVNGQPMTIIGVAPRGFRGTTLGADPDVFVPISMRGVLEAGFTAFENRRNYWIYVFARLKPGVSIEQARGEINGIYRPIVQDVEAPLQQGLSDQTLARFREKVLTLEEGRRGQSSLHEDTRTPLAILITITGIVLLIACANIANLLLVRGASRGQEMAIRGSLGASRPQLLGQLLSESLLLAALGGAASLVVARVTLGLLGSFFPGDTADTLTLGLNPPMVLFTAALAVGTGLLFGMYPALHATRQDLVTMLKAGGGQPSGTRAATRFRGLLVTSQIALSMTLLVAAGLFIRSLVNVNKVELGLDAENLFSFIVAPGQNGYGTEQSRILYERVGEELTALPGVSAVSGSVVPLLTGSNWANDVSVEGFESGPDVDANSRFNGVGAGYFATLGIPLLAGREFTTADDAGAPRVAVVNQRFAEKFGLTEGEAVGKRMAIGRSDDLDVGIVGLVRNATYAGVKQETQPLYFTPYSQMDRADWMAFYVRTAGDPSEAMRALPDMMERIDPNLPVVRLATLSEQVRENTRGDRLISMLAAAFASLATALAAIGLYGVLAYTVAQRTREIGLRMALGAGTRRVRAMVLRQVTKMTLVGAVIGIVVAILLGRAAQSLLFGLKGHDPLVVVVVTVVLGLVALAAGYLPALRASRVDPVEALRYE